MCQLSRITWNLIYTIKYKLDSSKLLFSKPNVSLILGRINLKGWESERYCLIEIIRFKVPVSGCYINSKKTVGRVDLKLRRSKLRTIVFIRVNNQSDRDRLNCPSRTLKEIARHGAIHLTISLALKRLKQEAHEFQASLSYIVKLYSGILFVF